jgi:hypothetical protein
VPQHAAAAEPDHAVGVAIRRLHVLQSAHDSHARWRRHREHAVDEVDDDVHHAVVGGSDPVTARAAWQIDRRHARLPKTIETAGRADPDVAFAVFQKSLRVPRGQAVDCREYIARCSRRAVRVEQMRDVFHAMNAGSRGGPQRAVAIDEPPVQRFLACVAQCDPPAGRRAVRNVHGAHTEPFVGQPQRSVG